MRIASLLPSATEIVCALGLKDHLVGVSHSC
ncbi:MAG: cobalamin-binding protein, partial [Pseudomonadota bacterium]